MSLLELHLFNLFGDPELNVALPSQIPIWQVDIPVAYDPFWWLKHPPQVLLIMAMLAIVVLYAVRALYRS